jgi:hypothetical protein
MSDQKLLDALSTFFDDVPDAVRSEISFLLVTLASDGAIEPGDETDYEQAARDLFDGETELGRLGNLISAAAVIDVYFAGDPQGRFAPMLQQFERLQGDQQRASLELFRNRYSERLAEIDTARRDWANLRRTVLAPTAISATLIPGFASSAGNSSGDRPSGRDTMTAGR